MSLNLGTLIKLVKLKPEIYHRNFLPDEYDNTWQAKEAAWDEISKKLDIDANILKKKWRTLRDQFQRNYKRVQSSNGEKIEVHWPYFEKLLFLKDHCKARDASINSSKNIENEDDNTQISHFNFEAEDGYVNEENVRYGAFETKFEAVTDDLLNQINNDDRDSTDYYLVTTSAEQNDDNLYDDKLQKNCDSNTVNETIKPPSLSRRKHKPKDSDNIHLSIKRAKYSEDSDDNNLDRQISECLESIKKKTESPMDHIDHFCNFIGSMIRQWPDKRQCEAMSHFTNYIMEKHPVYRNSKE